MREVIQRADSVNRRPLVGRTSLCTRLLISGVEILRFEMNFIATFNPVAECLATACVRKRSSA